MSVESPEAQDLALWRPIAVHDHRVPDEAPTAGWRGVWRRFRRRQADLEEGELVDPEPVAPDVLQDLVPSIDLELAAQTLSGELANWLERAAGAPRSIVLVGPPHSASQQVLRTWAASTEVVRLAAPSPGELDSGRWELALPDDPSQPVVLPALERMILRRSGGLALLRALLERLQRDGRRYACACDSWCWSLLSHSLPGQVGFDRVLAPAPYTASSLHSWFQPQSRKIDFVDARSGKSLLASGDREQEFLRSLAAYSRGIPGVASGLWSLALCQARLGAGDGDVRRCELPPWTDLDPPELPAAVKKQAALVLHALLLHDGLDDALLPTVLPLPAADVQTLLWDLAGYGVVSESDRIWRVSATGYPAVRTYLAALNVPLDRF